MIVRFALTASLMALAASASSAQDAPEMSPAEMDAGVEMHVQDVIKLATGQAADPYATLDNVEIVRTATGELLAPWVSGEACVAQHCALQISNAETGEIAFFDSLWLAGFIETHRGQQVLRVHVEADGASND